MYINKLSILNFKNIEQADIELHNGINCFTGSNGAGKTNIIDAVWYLSMCKSSVSMTDGQSVRHGGEYFMLSGQYESDSGRGETITCGYKRTAGKTVKRNGKEYEKLSEHIGIIPAVIVSPADTFLISDAADERRKWLNAFISQNDRDYLNSLIRYNHALSERNRLLKQAQDHRTEEILEVFDMQLCNNGEPIHRKRAETIAQLNPIVSEYYRAISGDREEVELSYKSELDGHNFNELLTASRQRDMLNQHTTSGIHRDDMVMKIGGYPLRKYGSQGQQKSFLIALKLAQYSMIAADGGEHPILLLDDLFDKLDADRLGALIRLVNSGGFGQTIISDCNHTRLTSILDGCGVDYRLFNVDNGEIHLEH